MFKLLEKIRFLDNFRASIPLKCESQTNVPVVVDPRLFPYLLD
jgi:hypothetical protein